MVEHGVSIAPYGKHKYVGIIVRSCASMSRIRCLTRWGKVDVTIERVVREVVSLAAGFAETAKNL